MTVKGIIHLYDYFIIEDPDGNRAETVYCGIADTPYRYNNTAHEGKEINHINIGDMKVVGLDTTSKTRDIIIYVADSIV